MVVAGGKPADVSGEQCDSIALDCLTLNMQVLDHSGRHDVTSQKTFEFSCSLLFKAAAGIAQSV